MMEALNLTPMWNRHSKIPQVRLNLSLWQCQATGYGPQIIPAICIKFISPVQDNIWEYLVIFMVAGGSILRRVDVRYRLRSFTINLDKVPDEQRFYARHRTDREQC